LKKKYAPYRDEVMIMSNINEVVVEFKC